jgi:hypothetical protein
MRAASETSATLLRLITVATAATVAAAIAATIAGQPAAAQSGNIASVAPPALTSDFDDGTTSASRGMGWVVSTDQRAGGTSTASMRVVDGGADGTAKSLETTGSIADGLPYAWAGPMLMPGAKPMTPVNLSAAKGLHFWARGDGRTYHVMLFAESRGQMPITVDFVAGPEWKEYSFPFGAFEGVDGHDIMGIAFTAGPEPGPFKFRLDQVSLR